MTKEQKALYDYLVQYVTDDEAAKIIIEGGEAGYYYGAGGYAVIDSDEAEDYIDEGHYILSDEALFNTYLIGSQP